MADTKVCPYHSLFATRYSLPFDQSPIAIRQSLPFSVVADSLMADKRVCPYHSLFATRYSLPFDQSPIAIRQSLPFFQALYKDGSGVNGSLTSSCPPNGSGG